MLQFDPRLSMYLDYLEMMRRQQAQGYSKGGRVVEFLTEMVKGKGDVKPTKDQPDPRRRRAIGLPPDPMSKTNEIVVAQPKGDETSSSLVQAMNIPMTRRDVLRAGAGQAISAMAPRGALGALIKAAGSPTGIVEQVITQPKSSPVQAAMSGPLSIQAMIAKAIKEAQTGSAGEFSTDEVMERVIAQIAQNPRRRPRAADHRLFGQVFDMARPEEFDIAGVYRESPGPLGLMKDIMNIKPKQDLRQVLRQVREINPEHYEKLKQVSRDIDDFLGTAYGDELRDLAREHGDDFGDFLD